MLRSLNPLKVSIARCVPFVLQQIQHHRVDATGFKSKFLNNRKLFEAPNEASPCIRSECLISNLEFKILFKVSRSQPHRVYATGFKTSIVLSNSFDNGHLNPLKFEIGACFEQRAALLNNELQYLKQIHLASPCRRNWIQSTFEQWGSKFGANSVDRPVYTLEIEVFLNNRNCR